MKVVCDTSPITNLSAIGQFKLLHELFGEVRIPKGVWEELNARGQKWPGRDDVDQAKWIKRQALRDRDLVQVSGQIWT